VFHPLLSSALERRIANIDGRLVCIFHRRVSRRRISHDGIDYSQLKGLKQVPGITRILRAPHVATLGLRISIPKSKNCANYTAPKSQAIRTRRSKIKSRPDPGFHGGTSRLHNVSDQFFRWKRRIMREALQSTRCIATLLSRGYISQLLRLGILDLFYSCF